MDEASRFMWVFLTKSKDPPLDIIDQFLWKFCHDGDGSIRSDQGGKLAKLSVLTDIGANSPLQNGAVETYNDKLSVWTWTIIYGATYWPNIGQQRWFMQYTWIII